MKSFEDVKVSDLLTAKSGELAAEETVLALIKEMIDELPASSAV
jgi:hypothetical protein